jgi:hypothetical protein
MSVERSGANYIVRVVDGEAVNRHKPSVEVLFESAHASVGRNALGVMLTGMGADGAKGHAQHARRRQLERGAGRGQLRRLRHAARSHRPRRHPLRAGAAR